MATIGRAAAIADFGWARFSGFLGWLLWLFVHIMFLVGFRNRLSVLLQWAASYMTYQRSVRLITGGAPQSGPDCARLDVLPQGDHGNQGVQGEETPPRSP
jgi:NADH:ubiquinone reductase (H+-translocating)